MASLSPARQLKFQLLDNGLALDPSALDALRQLYGDRELTPHDYASTSGIILKLEEDVWVNAPIERYNPNFVAESPFSLSFSDERFVVAGRGLTSTAAFWPQPAYHGTSNDYGPLNNYVVTHGDRGRLSPIRSCSMTCTFCNIPYDDPLSDYDLKPVPALLAAARTALEDPDQPARHLLISGGTPKPRDIGWMREMYAAVITEFTGVPVDLMMVPLPGLFDLPELSALGLNELSINLELFGRETSKSIMRHKYNQGVDFYLDFIERASEVLGLGRSRSMLMVGLEPMADTLAGVRAIAERGGTPVLSPFRPDPATPLSRVSPPDASTMRETYLRAMDILDDFEVTLGPDCPPCSHNTLNFADDVSGRLGYRHPLPRLLGSAA